MEQPQQATSQPRSTSGSARTHASRSSNPDKQISQIEKSVTHLLVATKQLLETLTQWSRGNAQEEEVSDVYVRLGYEFNLACRAFNSIGVETSDLGPVPDLLRTILEDTLSQPASPQALDNYLPRIRDIIINLLQGLKRKQSKLRSRPKQDAPAKNVVVPPARQASLTNTANSSETTLTPMMDNLPSQNPAIRSDGQRDSPSAPTTAVADTQDWTPANTSAFERGSLRRSIRRDNQSAPSSASSSNTAPSLPVLPSPDATDGESGSLSAVPFPHPPPPPPPPKQDALTALQRGGDLERRASRRFSAYQIQKHLGASPNGVPVIPPAQNSPIPNRGREARESMRAVTSRTSQAPARQKSTRLQEISPVRSGSAKAPSRISEEPEAPPKLETTDIPKISAPDDQGHQDSPTVKTPEEFHGTRTEDPQSPGPKLAATVNGPFSPLKETLDFDIADSLAKSTSKRDDSPRGPLVDGPAKSIHSEVTARDRASATPPPRPAAEFDASPSQTKELILFLQYKSSVKKFVLPGGYDELTLARLQLAFIEKFAWNTHNDGVDLPEIYIQDPVSGVRHELEDLSDVKDRSVLVLNVELLDEVKKHFDDGIGSLRTTLESVRSLLDGQGTLMQRFSDRQLETSKEMARLSAAPPPRVSRALTAAADNTTPLPASEASIAQVQTLRRDIAVLRQSYATMSSDFAAAMADIKVKAAHVKQTAAAAATPTYEGNAGRAHVNDGKKTLSSDSENLVNRVDDLSDRVEDLRKDVVARGVRPRARDLEVLSMEISATAKELAKVKEFMKREKPIWTKIWEQELNLVCTERDDLTQQEDLMADLHGDLEDVQNVFNLVEEAMKQQNLQGPGSLRPVGKTVEIDPMVDPNQAKEGVLDEVRALKPNHENRLEAIERAEKLRLKDMESRGANEFQREVEAFVEEGRLKKTGGIDEVERMRKLKDERAAKENWERAAAREAERERKRAEKAAGRAAPDSSAVPPADTADKTGETAEHVPSLAEIMGEVHTTDNDNSQEGDAAFQDAPTGTTPQVTPVAEHLEQAVDTDSPTLGPSESVTESRSTAPTDSAGGSAVEAKGEDPPASAADKRGSWWKPAVF